MNDPSSIERLLAPRRRAAVAGFTLVEAIAALTITAMAASVVLLAMETSVQSATDSVNQTIAQGLADQILDEALGLRYKAAGTTAYQYPLSPNAWEQAGQGRERYDDFDDFHGFKAFPMRDRFGQRLGQGDGAGDLRHPALRSGNDAFSQWSVAITVKYVSEADTSTPLPAGNTSDFRLMEVIVQHRSRVGVVQELARARRVVAYIPPPS